jgi:NAD-dependent dihydropyrimidine dehydrogenase PreA subunit
MRTDAIFIGIEVDDAVAGDAELAAKLEEVCPVDIYASEGGRVGIVESNVDECILCAMCIRAAPAGTVEVHKLYSGETVGAS